ncbi:MAG: gamma-glutamyltransferase [Alteromonadaceae bacterium]|nr:MAG: gamma-glutamyltransferase [Alteromonadaceae bacterium]
MRFQAHFVRAYILWACLLVTYLVGKLNRKVFCVCILSLLSIGDAVAQKARVTSDGQGAVASVDALATEIGIDIFTKGGNAIDAALATAFALGVVDSHNSGIGGGCFIVVHLADGRVFAIDGREMAPASAHRDMFLIDGKVVRDLSRTGALAVGVPGSVAALHHLQRLGGKLSFDSTLLPSADLAEKGFVIGAVMAKRLQRSAKGIAQFPDTATVFFDAKGKPLKAGDLLIQKDLAATYRRMAKKGPKFFYRGSFARAVDKWMKANGGLIRRKDFKNYRVIDREPVKTVLGENTIYGFGPPSSGGVHVAQILNILEHFDLAVLSEADRYHLVIEAMKLAFADRAHWVGDPDFVSVPKGLLSKAYAKRLASQISLKRVGMVTGHQIPPAAESDIFGKHTTHLVTADKQGNWVSITTTLNTSFGSKVMIPGTGVLMNNQMDDFSAQPGVPNAFGLVGSEANRVQSKKRPLSSMSPSIVVRDGKPILALGAAGGPTIISQVMQTLLNYLVLDMDLEHAMSAVRVHHQWKPDRVYIDGFASDSLRKALEARGHQLKNWPPFGATQAIAFENGVFKPMAEPRLKLREAH